MHPFSTPSIACHDNFSASKDWVSQFQKPPVEYRPVPFWSWNEWMEPAELARQVGLMAKAGLGGAFIHARMGLLTSYLGEEWFEACAATLQACREQGLIVWLYDEDKWPSGFSGGSVPLANPDFRHKSLIARPANLPAPPDCLPLGEAQNGTQVYRWLSPLGDPWFNGTTYADLLSGDAMRQFLEDAYEPYFERFGAEYGSLIVAQFTDEPCSSYRSRLPQGAIPFSDQLPSFFQEMHGYDPLPFLSLLFGDHAQAERFRLHYYQTVAALFELNFSAQLGQWCEAHGIALTGHYILEGTLYHQKLWGTQIMPHYRHQGIPGIDHLGRQIEERITAKQCQSVVNQYGKKRMLSELYGVAGGGLTFEDRWWIATQQITLGVNLLNPHLSLYTMAGCRKRDYPQNMFYQQPWWPLNAAVDEPLSRLCMALSQGKYHAEILVIHPQQSTFVLWQATQGDGVETLGMDWKPVTEAAESAVHALDADFQQLTSGLLGAQRTFDYGDETILRDAGLVQETSDGPRLVIGEMSYPLVILPSLETIGATTFQLLRQFQDAGGPILRCGKAPRWLDGEVFAELDAWLDSVPLVNLEELPEQLAQIQTAQLQVHDLERLDARLLWTHIRDLENGERLVWLVNLNRNRDFNAKITLRGPWKSVQELDARSGQTTHLSGRASADGLQIELPFARTQGHLLHLFPSAPVEEYSPVPQSLDIVHRVMVNGITRGFHLGQVVNGNGHAQNAHSTVGHSQNRHLLAEKRALELEIPAVTWQVQRLDDNALTLDYAAWKTGGDWSPCSMPVIALQEMLNRTHYSGPLSMRYQVFLQEALSGRKVHLVLERPDNYRILVNGVLVEPTGVPFWRDIRWIPLDISSLLQSGDNQIVLECEQFQFGNLAETHDQVARYGTEIESIYLVGDFAVEARLTGEEPRPANWASLDLPDDVAVRCIEQGSICLSSPKPLTLGDVTSQGLPFYAGRLQFSAPLPRAQGANSVVLRMERLDGAVAEVAINGEVVGTLWAHPLELELPASALEGGEISITLFGTLRNLLGPHHHSAGELVQVGPGQFLPTPAPEEKAQGAHYESWLVRWMNGETKPTDWDDRYCLLALGETGTLSLRYS